MFYSFAVTEYDWNPLSLFSLLPYFRVSGLNSIKITFFLNTALKMYSLTLISVFTSSENCPKLLFFFYATCCKITFSSLVLKPPRSHSSLSPELHFSSSRWTSSLSSLVHLPHFYLPYNHVFKCAICFFFLMCANMLNLQHGVDWSARLLSRLLMIHMFIKLTSSFRVPDFFTFTFFFFLVSLHTCAHTWMCM